MSAEREALPTAQSIAKYAKQNLAKAKKSPMMMDMMHHEGGQEIVREEDYKGHHIVVSTTYKITVDGTEVSGHIMLTNDGQVQYHGLPNYTFDSTVDLVKALVDNFPEDFEKKGKRPQSHGGMSGMDMGKGDKKASGMPGMDMSKSGKKSSGMAGMKMGSQAKPAKQTGKPATQKSIPAKPKQPPAKGKSK